MIHTRPEKQTDPAMLPGQRVNPIPEHMLTKLQPTKGLYLRDIIARIAAEEGVEIVSMS